MQLTERPSKEAAILARLDGTGPTPLVSPAAARGILTLGFSNTGYKDRMHDLAAKARDRCPHLRRASRGRSLQPRRQPARHAQVQGPPVRSNAGGSTKAKVH